MYFTDRGIEELAERRGEEQVTLGWLAERLGPEDKVPVFIAANEHFRLPVDPTRPILIFEPVTTPCSKVEHMAS